MSFTKKFLTVLALVLFPGAVQAVIYYQILQMHRAGHSSSKGSMPEIGYAEVDDKHHTLTAHLFINNNSATSLNIDITWQDSTYQYSINSSRQPLRLIQSPTPAQETPLLTALSNAASSRLSHPSCTVVEEDWSVSLDPSYFHQVPIPRPGKTSKYGNTRINCPISKTAQVRHFTFHTRRLLLLPISPRRLDREISATYQNYSDADIRATIELLTTIALLSNQDAYPPPYSRLYLPPYLPPYPPPYSTPFPTVQPGSTPLVARPTLEMSALTLGTLAMGRVPSQLNPVVIVQMQVSLTTGAEMASGNPPYFCRGGQPRNTNWFPDHEPGGGSGSSAY